MQIYAARYLRCFGILKQLDSIWSLYEVNFNHIFKMFLCTFSDNKCFPTCLAPVIRSASFLLDIKKLFCFYRPAHLGGAGATVLGAFLGGWTDDIFGVVGIDSCFVSGFEGFLDQFVLAGVESQDCHTSAWLESIWKFFHEFVENFKFTIHINTQCLKNSLAGFADGIFLFFLWKKIQSFLYDLA